MQHLGIQPRSMAKVRAQVLTVFSVVLALVVAAFVVAAIVSQEQAKRAGVERAARKADDMLRLRLDEEAALMRAAIDALTTHPTLRQEMEEGDAQALHQRIAPLFGRLENELGVGHLYVSRPDRSAFVKLEGEGRNGQVVDRLSLFEAAENGAPSYGLDLSALGTLTLRVVVPWRDAQGRLIGFVELGKDVAPLVDTVHRVLDVDLLVLVRKDLLDRDKWEEGERLSGRQGSWDELVSMVAVAQTLQSIPAAVGLRLEDGSHGHEAVIPSDKGRRVYSLATRPLLDVGQRQIGTVVLLRDVTDANREFNRGIVALTLFAAVAAAVGYLRCRVLLADVPEPSSSEETEETIDA